MDRARAIAGRVAAVLAVALAVALIGFVFVVPRLIGGATLTVLSGSMTPTLPVGSLVMIRPVEDPLALEPGDVITFQASPTARSLITHRVVRFQPDTTPPSYITKGDANRGEDIDPVPIGAIRGQLVTHVPYLGSVADQLGGPRTRYFLGLVVGAVVIVTQSRRLIGALRDTDNEDGTTDDAVTQSATSTPRA